MRGILKTLAPREGTTGSLRWIEPPLGKKEGWDVSDINGEGWDNARIRAKIAAAGPVRTQPHPFGNLRRRLPAPPPPSLNRLTSQNPTG